MRLLKIALLHMSAHKSDQSANLRKGDQFYRQPASQGADIALFPEMWNIGYTAYNDKIWKNDYNPLGMDEEEQKLRIAWQAQAVGPQYEFVVHFSRLTKELNIAIAVHPMTFEKKGRPRIPLSSKPAIVKACISQKKNLAATG
jgi:predicted amidohydrolase